jgi:multiple sugar transport system permease protein
MTKAKRYPDTLTALLFIAPAMILLFMFYVFPIFFTSFVSLHKWRIKRQAFLGFENFGEIFGSFGNIGLFALAIVAIYLGYRLFRRRSSSEGTGKVLFAASGLVAIAGGIVALVLLLPVIWSSGDGDMLDSFRVTIWYSLGTVPVQIILGMAVAILLDQKFKGKQAFRVIFLLPYIVPTVASAAVFERLFSLRSESFANQLIGLVGAKPLAWLGEVKGIFDLMFGWGRVAEEAGAFASYWQSWAQGPSLALVSIMFFNYWAFVGYYALIYSNGLANIPRQLYEAAEVDGANRRTVLFRIIIPLLSPTTFFLTVLGIIGTFKAFNHIYVLRTSAIRGAADPMSIYIFFTFFRRSRFGYAAGLSLILFAFVLALTLFQRKVMEHRVEYGE